MIIWISGAYGVGKSTLAEALARKMDNAMVFDAEEVGNAVRGNYPGEPYGVIYEDYPLWCDFNFMLLRDLHRNFHHNILVPMTLLRLSSYAKIIRPLLDEGIDTRLIILEASHSCIHRRILARGEKDSCWCIEQIDAASQAAGAIPSGFHILTDQKSVDELTQIVLDHLQKEQPRC